MITPAYTGRFAPSPTGALHLGSLLAAVASYCDARAHKGRWLVRIEDIDPLREQPGASTAILQTLDAFGLEHDDEIRFQHTRSEAYEAAITRLFADGHAYWCTCSRKQLQGNGACYPGTCRGRILRPDGDAAIRVHTPDREIIIDDALQGRFRQQFGVDTGDFVIKRKEGFYAYHLAVVIDDAEQGITHIVRGIDLLDSTPAHRLLQQWLGLPTPHYAHLPVIINDDGQKLSKQTFASALRPESASEQLLQVLSLLGQQPPASLAKATPREILAWAVSHWELSRIPAQRDLRLH